MSKFGINLTIVCAFILIFICVMHLIIKNSRKKQFYLKIGLTFFSIFWIAYFLIMRWVPNLETLLNYGGLKNLYMNVNGNEYQYSFIISKVFLMDLCPFMSIFLPITIIISNRQMNIAKIFAPIGFFCGFITVFFGCTQNSLGNNSLGQYIFAGIGINKLYFLMHFVLMVLSLIILLNYARFNLLDYFLMLLFLALYLSAVEILVQVFHVTNNATGLVKGDWFNFTVGINVIGTAEYGTVADFFPNVSYPGLMYLSYFLVWLALSITVIIKYFLTFFTPNKQRFISLNITWYKKYQKHLQQQQLLSSLTTSLTQIEQRKK
ncbi:DUF5378 family protein [Ureaplasma ceti]